MDVCTVCPLAKQKQLSFPFNNNLCSIPFALINLDVWGPYSISTHDGFKYFLTIVDDATKFTWAFLMKTKYELRPLIMSSYNMIQTQFEVGIKAI